jgi:hypothetical protein
MEVEAPNRAVRDLLLVPHGGLTSAQDRQDTKACTIAGNCSVPAGCVQGDLPNGCIDVADADTRRVQCLKFAPRPGSLSSIGALQPQDPKMRRLHFKPE